MTSLERAVRAVVASVACATIAVTSAVPAPAQTLGTNNLPITNAAGVTFGVLSHRGGALEWPENSAEAFAGSAAAGFDSIETDLLFTSDGQSVMSHYDKLPERCTNAGQSLHLMTAAEVAEVRCADLAGNKTVPLATFADLASALAMNPQVKLTLDLKSYDGQPAAEQRAYASRAMQLLHDHGLLGRTSILTFFWKNHLPVIRKAAPKLYVLALDNGTMDLDKVRLADKLKANGYGIKMKYTSEYLVKYTKAKGMDAVPWEVLGNEQRAFSIRYGGKLQLFSSDEPSKTRAELVSGLIDLNPKPTTQTTTLPAPVLLSQGKLKAGVRSYPVVLGPVVPAAEVSQLRSVKLSVTVTGGKGKGRLYVGGMSTPLSSSTSVALPKGSKTFTMTSVLGDKGKLRIYASRTVTVAISVVGYSRVRFA